MSSTSDRFDDVVLRHRHAAHRLARWLIGDDDADDVVQEALLRAFRYFPTFSGTDGRAWLLTIVRNTARGWYARKRRAVGDEFNEELHSDPQVMADPETLLLHADAIASLEHAMSALPERSRELLVMRLEELSYQQMADALQVPIGTVMSGLSRARRTLRRALSLDPSHQSHQAAPRQTQPVSLKTADRAQAWVAMSCRRRASAEATMPRISFKSELT